MTKEWFPHELVPWSQGRDFDPNASWDPDEFPLGDAVRSALYVNLLTEDNLPYYFHSISKLFGEDGAWGTWNRRWTAEEHRHSIVIRDWMTVTRAIDPVALERARMAQVSTGFVGESNLDGPAEGVIYVTLQELATRISHRNTGRLIDDRHGAEIMSRVAADENLHMIFYRNMCAAALDLSPDQAIEAITLILENFQMPGAGMPNFRRNGVLMAKHGIYDLRQHLEEVVQPVLKKWNVFERNDFGARGESARDELAVFVEKLGQDVLKFEEQRDRLLAREAARGILQPI